MKIFEYERNHLGDRPKIQIESIEDKVKFLVQVLQRLKIMYVKGVKERIDEIHDKMGINESDLDYPTIPDHLKNTDDKKMDPSLTLEQQTDKIISDIEIIELNRVKREKLT